jgi:DNA replication and repair protein RecF
VILSRLATENFRNLSSDELEFHPAANIIVGRNGQGKTNLLEAIYFLATSKSFRTTRLASVFLFDSPSVFVRGTLDREGLQKELSVGLEGGESRRRVLMINRQRATLTDYVAEISVLAYSSARLEIVRGTPEERRRFLDRGIAGINSRYLNDLSRYGRVLKQRNALLQAVASGQDSIASLDAWDDEFAVTAAVIHKARAQYTEAIAAALSDIIARHNYHVRDIAVEYKPSFVDDIKRLRRQEARARMTLLGPQRDLLEFQVGGRPAAEVLSGGEQKMLVLFLKFAKLELFRDRMAEAPLLLLDDIDAELDLEILQNLLARMPRQTQLFATSAKEAFLGSVDAGNHRRLLIENGGVTSARDFP